jgi:O-antigen ligase
MSRITLDHRFPIPNLAGVVSQLRSQFWFGTPTLLFYLTAVTAAASLILGGGTRGGFLSDAILQLLSIPLLLVSLWRLFESSITKEMRLALGFCLTIALLPFVQLVPLPPWLWTVLPNRQPSVEAFTILGHAIPWMPISVAPQATWLSALSLIPPLAIFLGTLLLTFNERRQLSLVVIGIGIVSLFIGLMQIAQGPNSPLRFFEVTNLSEAVGFFANRNHYAAFLYCVVLFVAAWSVHVGTKGNAFKFGAYNVFAIVWSIVGFTLFVGLLVGEAMARSRAGLGLTIVALFGSLALFAVDRREVAASQPRRWFSPTKILVGGTILATALIVQFTLYRVMQRFGVDSVEDARHIFVRNTIEAAKAYMPFGSGLGTFVPVYAMFEKPADVADAYINHAHNDPLELWLETGFVGPLMIVIFVAWLLWRSMKIWRPAFGRESSALDRSLARAATIAIALVLVHSVVDYPLRTGAMMALMAFACALMIPPPARAAGEEMQTQAVSESFQARAKRRPKPSSSRIPEETPINPVAAAAPFQRWATDINWPKEWSKPPSDEKESSGDDPV